MGDFIRRLFWLVPLLGMGAASLFGVLSVTLAPPQRGAPLFFNPRPRDAESEAARAVGLIARSNPEGVVLLRQLGGAALPHILPRLDTLDVRQQRLVADALWPVAERMGIWERDTLARSSDPADVSDQRLVFWRQYDEEHTLDFRALSVQRLVKRLSARDLLLRRADLLVVDTYALPALVEALGRVRTPADVERVERIAELISHVTERDFSLTRGATVAEARARATSIRSYWDRAGGAWTQMTSLERMAASLGQTEFSVWVRQSYRQASRLDESPLATRLASCTRASAPRYLLTLLGALILGPALAGALQVLDMRRFGSRGRRAPVRIALALALCTLLPGTLLHAGSSYLWGGLLTVGAGALSSAYLLQRELSDRIDWRTRHVLGRQSSWVRVAALFRWLGPSIPALAPLVAGEAALWATCLELGTGAPGIGPETLRALGHGDLPWLMSISLLLGVLTGGLQLVSDAFIVNARLGVLER